MPTNTLLTASRPVDQDAQTTVRDATPTPPMTIARQHGTLRKLASEVGQGTVEYVGLLLLMATLLAAVVAGAKNLGGDDQIGKKVVTQIGKSIDKAGNGAR